MASLLLGVDGGNTKTIALLAAADGGVVGAGRSGCGDIYGTTPEAALAELDRAIDAALRMAGGHRDDIVSAGFSLAGADWPEDYAFLEAEMAQRVAPSAALLVVNDAIGALRGGSSDGLGVSIVCGTGSSIGARADGRTWHASFWGEDNGAVALGRLGLRAVVRSDLGLDPATDLTRRALAAFQVATVDELLHGVTRRGTAASIVARLAPEVLDAADAGDDAAIGIVTRAGSTLGSYAGVAATRVGLVDRPFPLVLAGGVFRHPGSLLRQTIVSMLPGAHPVATEFEPAAGALLLAFDAIARTADTRRLRDTMPRSEFFASHATGSGGPGAERLAVTAPAGVQA